MTRLTNVLVVDDDAQLCRLYATVLKKLLPLVTIHTAESLKDAAHIACQEPIDAIIVDLLLGDTCGTEAVAFFVAFYGSRSIANPPPIIAISGNDNLASAAIEAGAHSFIGKGWAPTHGEILVHAMREALDREPVRPLTLSAKKLEVDKRFAELLTACAEKERDAHKCAECPLVAASAEAP